jgi:hypothetical protein
MDDVVKDDSVTGENVNLISPDVDDTQPVDISPDVPDAEEQKEEEDPANIGDESPDKQLINQVDIPSLVGSV